MCDILFRQSDKENPYAFYREMRQHQPVYYDQYNDIWGVYAFEDCRTVLTTREASIPESPSFSAGLTDDARSIANNLARLGNVPDHTPRRDAAIALFRRYKPVDVTPLMSYLLREPQLPAIVDWVGQIGCRLPAFTLLKGLGFSTAAAESIVNVLPALATLMHPVKSPDDVALINEAVAAIIPMLHDYVGNFLFTSDSSEVEMYRSNLAGLLIQSFEAGRGLLSHGLLWAVRERARYMECSNKDMFVREVLRFDPPVQHTRRELIAEIRLGDRVLKKGSKVLVVLASANRDDRQFQDPDLFDPSKQRGMPYITFGSGAHQCIAEHFSIHVTSSALQYLDEHYRHVVLKENEIRYEPKVNVRLPVRMMVELG